MSDSDSESINFTDPLWADVVPRPQDEGPSPVCPIAYSPDYVALMNYFRAFLHSDEKSERALKLLNQVLRVQPANYTAWFYRRRVLDALGNDYKAEFPFVEEICSDNPKNYQIWYHRQIVVEKTNDTSKEKEFIASVIDQDSKNYHAWSYRQWLVKRFNLWEGELEYVEKLLNEDIRNNSAWNHRFYVLENTQNLTRLPENNPSPLSEEKKKLIENEIRYSFEKIRKSPNNQSGWLYLRGIVHRRYNEFPEVKEQALELQKKIPFCATVLAFLLDVYLHENNYKTAHETCEELCKRCFEPQRKYWNHRKAQIEKLLCSEASISSLTIS
eukprot:TRINITY_DN1439_c0_g3_i1.p1 TRINITY_DN1439_c0_g3~~TRINITY_DN1439_c0_g3_i1.p1  ORF type:complete len:337 (+),score=89.54 TRINITY_DN1439_c0_g3_i1:30-1013(+)